MTKSRKMHYYLIAGNVVIQVGDDAQAFPSNAMVTLDTPHFGLHAISKAQQALQVQLFNKMGATAHVVDVLLVSVCPLGFMTKEQFEARPEGYEVQEKVPMTAEVIDITEKLKGES